MTVGSVVSPTPRWCPECGVPYVDMAETVWCRSCGRSFSAYLALLTSLSKQLQSEASFYARYDPTRLWALRGLFEFYFDGLLSNLVELGTSTLPVGRATTIRLWSAFESIWRVQTWPTSPGALTHAGGRTPKAIAERDPVLVVLEGASGGAMSLVPIPNPHAESTVHVPEMIDVHWFVYGIARGTNLEFDRRVLALAVQRFFDADFELAQLAATIAAEAGLNRFLEGAPNARKGSTLSPKMNEFVRWCREHQPRAAALRVQALHAPVMRNLAQQRNTFGHGHPPTDESMSLALKALATSASLLTEIERTMHPPGSATN